MFTLLKAWVAYSYCPTVFSKNTSQRSGGVSAHSFFGFCLQPPVSKWSGQKSPFVYSVPAKYTKIWESDKQSTIITERIGIFVPFAVFFLSIQVFGFYIFCFFYHFWWSERVNTYCIFAKNTLLPLRVNVRNTAVNLAWLGTIYLDFWWPHICIHLL